ncbi:hypothetical protein DFH27DRAFT_655623 [Peziza echinospora]|nr:hypothetical protein DFH27DRAFT_655623 [Peziza echinospora]
MALLTFCAMGWSNQRFSQPMNPVESQIAEDLFSEETKAPHVSLSGSVLYPVGYTGYAQALFPFMGSEEEGLTYGILLGQYSSQDWSVGAGGGIRYALDSHLTLCGYGVIEHQRSALGNGFWRLSPGIELQGDRWHLTANAYLPLGKNAYLAHDFSPASKRSLIDYTTLEFSRFEGHTGFVKTSSTFVPASPPITERYEVGLQGVDLLGHWQLNSSVALSLGSYYLPSQLQSRFGIVAGLAYQMESIAIEIQAHGDQAGQQIQARVILDFGSNNAASTQRIRRSLQRLGAEWARPAVQTKIHQHSSEPKIPEKPNTPPLDPDNYPQIPNTQPPAEEKIENLYFFKKNGRGDTCTFEKPCSKISQKLVDDMPQHSILLLAEGGSFEVDYTGAKDRQPYWKNALFFDGVFSSIEGMGGIQYLM